MLNSNRRIENSHAKFPPLTGNSRKLPWPRKNKSKQTATNALRSTGPRTPEGKNAVRLNAIRDGITGQVTTLSDEDRPVFETFKTSSSPTSTPDPMELSLANAIAWDTWRLNHLRAVEMNIYALGPEHPAIVVESAAPDLRAAVAQALAFATDSARLGLMSLYEQRLTRTLHKNLASLREIQAERKLACQHDLDEEITIARGCDFEGSTYQAPAAPTPNGFVFSTDEVRAAARRLTTSKWPKSPS